MKEERDCNRAELSKAKRESLKRAVTGATAFDSKPHRDANKYREGIFTAVTSSLLIVYSWLFIMSFDIFYPQKQLYSSFDNNFGQKNGQTDERDLL